MRRLWYIRRGGSVTGPFPLAAIEQDFLLGRFKPQDELSEDRELWVRVAEQPELAALVSLPHPDAPTDELERDWRRERLEALRRWADQRTGQDRRDAATAPPHPGRRQGERREPRDELRRPSDASRASPSAQPRGAWRLLAAILAIVVLILIAIAYHLGTVVPVPVRLG
jgi:hypothetical protein